MSLTLTRDQVRRIDALAINRYGIAGIVLMENAGRNAAALIDARYGPRGSTLICCGPGNNGGDGCVIARHLYNVGWRVRLLVTGDASRMSAEMLANFRIAEAMGLELNVATDLGKQRGALRAATSDDVFIDAILGTGFRGELRPQTAELIRALNGATRRAMVAIDVPSGLDCDTGRPGAAAVRADLTITFVARKIGFCAAGAAGHLGDVEVVDIGAPRDLLEDVAGKEP